MTVGRATYEPGWRWSEHVAPTVGTASCQLEHVGLVLSGQAVAKMDDGTERLMKAGDFFYVPPGHDSWVVVATLALTTEFPVEHCEAPH